MKKRYTVITGASSGIGYYTAKAFAAKGKNLILCARRMDRLEALREEIAKENPIVDVALIPVDLLKSEEVYHFYQKTEPYFVETWINNAGFGSYGLVADQEICQIQDMLRLNVEALAILSHLYVEKYAKEEGCQLMNISSAGGYQIVPTGVTYCGTKFFVSAFTEGLARELQENGLPLKAKVLAPAATQTEFGKVANQVDEYDYDKVFGVYHTAKQMANFLVELYESDQVVGKVNRETFEYELSGPLFPYAGAGKHNQKLG